MLAMYSVTQCRCESKNMSTFSQPNWYPETSIATFTAMQNGNTCIKSCRGKKPRRRDSSPHLQGRKCRIFQPIATSRSRVPKVMALEKSMLGGSDPETPPHQHSCRISQYLISAVCPLHHVGTKHVQTRLGFRGNAMQLSISRSQKIPYGLL